MYYHHYALYYDLSCQCAVQCTVILILLPVGRNVVATLLDPPYDDDDGDAVMVDNDDDGGAR